MAPVAPSRLVFVPIAESDGQVQIWHEKRGTAAGTDSTLAAGRVRDTTLMKEVMINLCNKPEANCTMHFRSNNSMPKASAGFMSAGQKADMTTDFRSRYAGQGKYIFAKRYLTTCASGTVYARGMGSASHAVRNGFAKALKEITNDKE